MPENLPALLYARKLQRRAASAGGEEARPRASAARALREAADELAGLLAQGESAAPGRRPGERAPVERALGELLFAPSTSRGACARDPELALRAAADRFRRV